MPKIHLKAIKANGTHTTINVFINGANCGELTFREDEAVFFHDALMHSKYLKSNEILSSGIWIKEKE